MKILCIHGVGRHDDSTDWQSEWISCVEKGIAAWSEKRLEFRFTQYDDLFEAADLDAATVAEALLRLTASGLFHGIGDLFDLRSKNKVARSGLTEQVRWTAGMVAQWIAGEDLRKACRDALAKDIREFKPDIILAHSLGSLIAYDALVLDQELSKGKVLVTFGSQIGNPAVRQTFAGRIVAIEDLKHWYHLFNRHDSVFTSEIDIASANFMQISTDFDIAGIADHSAVEYLGHANTSDRVWRTVAVTARALRQLGKLDRAFAEAKKTPTRRALLVGINDYPDPTARLDGCVNDVYEVSSALQQLGFEASEIRVILNDRATASGIKERLHWLLEDTTSDDIRFFFYSGHGAQMSGYGAVGEVDHIDECLVPYDFAWTKETAIIDDWFYELYSQLPYDVRFYTVLDCCNSGGAFRAGARKAKGLEPPDDIRHRRLEWNTKAQMWVERKLALAERDLAKSEEDRKKYTGDSGAVKRLGRAVSLWSEIDAFEKAKKQYRHFGPYMPVILYACREDELSFEYRHGATSYGAFTFCLTQLLKEEARKNASINFDDAIKLVSQKLKDIEYDQHPDIVGPEIRRRENVFSLLSGPRSAPKAPLSPRR